MIDNNKHRYFLVQILKDIYSDRELANLLGFKGGTALMFFYDLPRFSVDLDFNLLDIEQQKK
jgi:predicted nucleotidyltransferase component of viral defense system